MKEKPVLLVIWHGALFPSYRKPFWILHERYAWDVHLLAVHHWSKALPRRTRFQSAEGEPIELHVHRAFLKFHGAFYFHPLFPYLFMKIQPDIVYIVEEPFSFTGWTTTYWCKRNVPNIPVILFSYQDIEKRYPPPFRWMERYVLDRCDRILTSNIQGGRVIERKGYTKLWDTLPSAVNLDAFPYKEPRPHDPLFTLGYVGRLADEKGLDTLLWALTSLSADVRLRLVGDGPARYRLELLAKELGVYERVAFLPPVPHEELSQIYHEFDALVLPSKTTPNWQEQFGRVLIESMACGTPVIGSDSGAIPDVIGDAGLIFPETNAHALADKIMLLQRDKRLQNNLSFKGRIRAEQQFSTERAAQKLNRHLSEVYHHARGA